MNDDMSVLTILDARALELKKEHQEAQAKVREAELRLHEVSIIREHLSRSARSISTMQPNHPAGQDEEPDLMGPTAAIIRLLEESPGGLRSLDIVNQLQDKIATSSTNPRRLIQSVVEGLKRKGRLTQNMAGKLFLKNDPHGSNEDGEEAESPTQALLVEENMTPAESA